MDRVFGGDNRVVGLPEPKAAPAAASDVLVTLLGRALARAGVKI